MVELHLDADIQSLIDQVESADNGSDLNLQKALNEKLYALSKERNDEKGMLISEYYECSALFDQVEFEVCEQKLLRLRDQIKQHTIPLYEIRTYNLLAVISSESANHFESLNYYLHALHITSLHSELKYSCIISNNIGKLFIELNEYEAALPILLQAYEYFLQEYEGSQVVLVTITLNIMECYSSLKQYDKAVAWSTVPLNPDTVVQRTMHSMLLANKIEEDYDKQDFQSVRLDIKMMIDEALEDDMYVYFFKIYLRVLNIALILQERELSEALMSIMDHLNRAKPKGTKIASFLYEYVNLKAVYFEQFIKEKESFAETVELLDEYILYSSQIVNQLKKTYAHSMVVQLEKKQVEMDRQSVIKENEILEKNIQLDTFTGLYNKTSIKLHVDDYLAKHPYMNQALFVLDIDFFKRVNDNYGHEVGDDILLEVASVLKALVRPNDLVGRFGGDEFIIFFSDYENQNALVEFSQHLVEKGREICIPQHNDHHITFSVGIACCDDEDDFDSVFRKADKALFDRKQCGRDGFTMYHNEGFKTM